MIFSDFRIWAFSSRKNSVLRVFRLLKVCFPLHSQVRCCFWGCLIRRLVVPHSPGCSCFRTTVSLLEGLRRSAQPSADWSLPKCSNFTIINAMIHHILTTDSNSAVQHFGAARNSTPEIHFVEEKRDGERERF